MTTAQAQHIFIYILTIVVVALIFLFGYRFITSFGNTATEAALTQFQTQLQRDLTQVASDYGTITQRSYRLSQGTELCIIASAAFAYPPEDFAGHEQLRETIVDGTPTDTVWVLDGDAPLLQFDDGTIELVGTSLLCKPFQGGEVTVRMEGRGDAVVVS